ncbi:related to SHE9 - mitochondrial inner membrane protein [Melanopsichium pennsylvanicum]|uniref:Sensitive to high expression protein 9, mitochondrial n=2 Tax=Melanopsichium pennsylvanicum TaxID=63383 RepID=A0AAJ4XPV1_9BASI|nr:related to SHE9 - mitochondrial inner membrane protein [Melanopsichium pennsylvanicum]
MPSRTFSSSTARFDADNKKGTGPTNSCEIASSHKDTTHSHTLAEQPTPNRDMFAAEPQISKSSQTSSTTEANEPSAASGTMSPSSSPPPEYGVRSSHLSDSAAQTSSQHASSSSHPDTTNRPSSTFSQQQSIIDRLRQASSTLPKFDALNSSAALSQALEKATAHTHKLTSDLRSRLSNLSAQYNTYSGYAQIEELKLRITGLEKALDTKREQAVFAKKTYLSAVQNRSTSQRETNDLLSRKNDWTETDLSRYTQLLRTEHALSRQEQTAEKELERCESEVETAFDEMMKAIMVRYHEEQIWSEKMRGMSTYGSLIVAGLNAFLFILAILLVEPYKRKRLAQTFEERLVRAEEQSRELILESIDEFKSRLDAAPISSSLEREVQNDEAEKKFKPSEMTLVQTQKEAKTLPPAAVQKFIPSEEPQDAKTRRSKREQEDQLVFASTLGVVVGAGFSLLISACWS